jgi:hypothetical protein
MLAWKTKQVENLQFTDLLFFRGFTDLLYHTRARKRVNLSASRHDLLYYFSTETDSYGPCFAAGFYSGFFFRNDCGGLAGLWFDFFFGGLQETRHNSYIQERTRTPLSQQ